MHRDTLDDSGIVHEDVHRSEGRGDVFDHRLHSSLVGAVADVTFRLDAEGLVRLKSLVHIRLCTAVERDLCAGLCKGLSHCESDSVSGSCNQGHLSFKREIYHVSFSYQSGTVAELPLLRKNEIKLVYS